MAQRATPQSFKTLIEDVVHATVGQATKNPKNIASTYANATQDEYNAAAREALAAAITRGNQDGGSAAAQAAPAPESAPLELTAPTVAEVTAQQDRVENAAKEEQAKRQAASRRQGPPRSRRARD